MPKNRKIDREYLAIGEQSIISQKLLAVNKFIWKMVNDESEVRIAEEEILRIALLVSGSIIPMIVEDEFEYPIPEHTSVLTGDLFYRLSMTPFFSLFIILLYC